MEWKSNTRRGRERDFQVQEKYWGFFNSFFSPEESCPRIKKPDTLSNELQEAKVGKIRPLKASISLAQKYTSRWSDDDPAAWRRGSAKEPRKEILSISIRHVYILANSFRKSMFSSEAMFHKKKNKLQSVWMLPPCYNIKAYGHSVSAFVHLFLLPSYALFPFAEFRIIKKCTQVLYSAYSVFDSSLPLLPTSSI